MRHLPKKNHLKLDFFFLCIKCDFNIYYSYTRFLVSFFCRFEPTSHFYLYCNWISTTTCILDQERTNFSVGWTSVSPSKKFFCYILNMHGWKADRYPRVVYRLYFCILYCLCFIQHMRQEYT